MLVLGVKKLRGMHRVVSSKHPRALEPQMGAWWMFTQRSYLHPIKLEHHHKWGVGDYTEMGVYWDNTVHVFTFNLG